MKKTFLLLLLTPFNSPAMQGQTALQTWKIAVENRAQFTDSGDVLCHFIADGKKEIVEAALNDGIPVDIRGLRVTPLIQASKTGQLKIVEMLLARGANPNLTGAYSFTALDYVVIRLSDIQPILQKDRKDQEEIKNYENIIETLLKAGAKPNITVKVRKAYLGSYYDCTHLATAIESAKELPNVLQIFQKYGYGPESDKFEIEQ